MGMNDFLRVEAMILLIMRILNVIRMFAIGKHREESFINK
jgi:hypothetical protein